MAFDIVIACDLARTCIIDASSIAEKRKIRNTKIVVMPVFKSRIALPMGRNNVAPSAQTTDRTTAFTAGMNLGDVACRRQISLLLCNRIA